MITEERIATPASGPDRTAPATPAAGAALEEPLSYRIKTKLLGPPLWMGSLLGVMFLGLSILAARVHAMPYDNGTPTVISQVGKIVYGETAFGHLGFYLLQAGTMLILVLAANTSFADFPRLASFHAGDNFMPRQFMVRGHRLVFSNGIVFLAGAAIVTLLATGGEVSRLIPLYAIGVFTSFTLSQAGMTKHHFREKEPGWRTGAWINGIGAALSLLPYIKRWHRILHDRSSSGIAMAMSGVPHCAVTIVPYHLGSRSAATPAHHVAIAPQERPRPRNGQGTPHLDVSLLPDHRTPMQRIGERDRATVAGRVRSLRVQPWSGTPSLECTLADESGSVTVVFFGRRSVGGVRPGTIMSVTGRAGRHHGMTAMLNPEYTIISTPPMPDAPGEHH